MRLFPFAKLLPLLLLPVLALAVGCNDDNPAAAGVPADAVPDFSLVDANTTSPTYGQAVSPRDYLRKVSAWYFGHAT